MNFDEESKSDEKKKNFFFGRGRGVGGKGGSGEEEERDSNEKIINRYSLIFCAYVLYKISSSWVIWFSSFNTNKVFILP